VTHYDLKRKKCNICNKKASQYVIVNLTPEKNFETVLKLVLCHKHRLKTPQVAQAVAQGAQGAQVMTPRQWKDMKAIMDVMEV
jgi:hypothetical protein